MGFFWFVDPFVLGESFLLLKSLCKKRGHEGLREAHVAVGTSHRGLLCRLCSAQVSTGEPGESGVTQLPHLW